MCTYVLGFSVNTEERNLTGAVKKKKLGTICRCEAGRLNTMILQGKWVGLCARYDPV
jgi:hypothetical protein